jgi:hypothetical protein
MPPLPHWSSTTVTVLGDAIHNMTPMGGVGANAASEARLPRIAVRTLLRLAEAFPPVKRAVFRPASS